MQSPMLAVLGVFCFFPGLATADRDNHAKMAAIAHVGKAVDKASAANDEVFDLVHEAANSSGTGENQSNVLFGLATDAWRKCREAETYLEDAMQTLESLEDQFHDDAGKQFYVKMKHYLAGESISGKIYQNCNKTQKIVDDIYDRQTRDEEVTSLCFQKSMVFATVFRVVTGVAVFILGVVAFVFMIVRLLGFRIRCEKC